ncbi:beta-lactamase family protein [Fulvivirga sp. 29W222]|uniref:Beta-lactamase family protein n=1 Tax=Fulvivirga marina TaxID=2494733 RepID=A0A937FWA6_9BACT|nr:serine hydrolase domain-containing protein [Fulvivirga marina]MBL6445797.1 beta-lactamase family protein [Fulvivirga marina]
MKKRYIFILLIVCGIGPLLFFSLSGNNPILRKPVGKPDLARTKPYAINRTDKQFLKDFDSYIAEQFDATNTPGATVAIVKKGAVIYQKAFGLKASGGIDSINTKTLFRLASVSKGFSSILAALMAKDTLFNMSDPISSYLKYPISGSASDITIRHILSHTAGFPYQAYSTLVEDELPRDTMIRKLLKIPLSRLPGRIHSYQNVAYSIIEVVLESSSGKLFPQLMHKHIFEPLEMNHSSLSYDSMISNNNIAIPHEYRHGQYIPTTVKPSYYNVAAAGGLNTNIEDLSKWLAAVLGNKTHIIPSSVLDTVFKPVIPIRVKNPYFSQFEKPRNGFYGLGWRIMEYPNDTLIYHGGYANGYKSGIALDRNKNIGICVLTNAPSKFSNLIMINFFKMYKQYFKEQPASKEQFFSTR